MMTNAGSFEYQQAFSRNLGLVSETEQDRLRSARVAIPGLGGVGGGHLQTLARMGVCSFHLADPDTFEVVNINRQMGASTETVGRSKAEVMGETARRINPHCKVETFPEGINLGNIDAFLSGVDVVVDGLDFFALDARRLLYRACHSRGIPVVNAGPVGYGAALLVFLPDGPSFDDYFGLRKDMTRAEQLLAIGLGLVPTVNTDIDPSRMRLEAQQAPALASTCMLCSAAAATEVLKLLSGRGHLAAVPHGTYIDLFRGRVMKLKRRPALRGTLRGRLIRWLAFRRCPAFQTLHENELAARALAVTG